MRALLMQGPSLPPMNLNGGRGLGLALALGATVLNAIIFLALTSSYAADAR